VQHIIDSLLQDDDQLKNLLHPQPEPLRALYIFQSKIVRYLCYYVRHCYVMHVMCRAP